MHRRAVDLSQQPAQEVVRMKSPISFKEWLLIMGIVLISGVVFLLLDQIPLFSYIIDRITDWTQVEYIS